MNLSSLLLQAGIGWSPTSLIIAVVVILLCLLLLRFVVKTAFTLVKIAIIVLIGVGVYLGLQTIL